MLKNKNQSEKISESYARQTSEEQRMGYPSSIIRPDSIDAWRHYRILDELKPLFEHCPEKTWMTIGDGRFGSDAFYLKKKGLDVLATSLFEDNLRKSSEDGYINKFKSINAEDISMDDESIDFIICKEAYHHFPRPPVGLYEMLRVAKTAVILIEPAQENRIIYMLKGLLKFILRGEGNIQFEISGNFLYKVDLKELKKLLCAMGGYGFSHKGINDFYSAKLGSYPEGKINIGNLVTKIAIATQNLFSKVGLYSYGLHCVVIFKDEPQTSLTSALKKNGYKNIKLPINPYS